MAEGLADRYGERIAGIFSCYDRIVITGTVAGICHAKGMTSFLYASGIRIFDYPQFAATLRDKVRENAALCCPVLDTFKQSYHWSLMQVEYSTDLVFRSKAMLAPLYEQLARHSVLTVKAETIATFLGRKSPPTRPRRSAASFPPASKEPASSTASVNLPSKSAQVARRAVARR